SAAGEDLGACAAVLARIIPGGAREQVILRVDALHGLEERGLPVINSPRAIERTVDKRWTSALLERAGLPVPETVVCDDPDEALAAFRALGDVIVKPLFGSMGLGMVRVTTEEMAFRVFRTLETIRGVYYLQRAIDHEGCDGRAFVVADRGGGAIERRAAARVPARGERPEAGERPPRRGLPRHLLPRLPRERRRHRARLRPRGRPPAGSHDPRRDRSDGAVGAAQLQPGDRAAALSL